MTTYRLKPIWSKILGIALAVILVASLIGIVITLCKPWKWLLIPGLCGITYFGAKPAYVFIKDLIEKGIERIKENKSKDENPKIVD